MLAIITGAIAILRAAGFTLPVILRLLLKHRAEVKAAKDAEDAAALLAAAHVAAGD